MIRELPDTVKQKETEAEAYSAVWDLMIALEKELPMSYIFYGQDSLVKTIPDMMKSAYSFQIHYS